MFEAGERNPSEPRTLFRRARSRAAARAISSAWSGIAIESGSSFPRFWSGNDPSLAGIVVAGRLSSAKIMSANTLPPSFFPSRSSRSLRIAAFDSSCPPISPNSRSCSTTRKSVSFGTHSWGNSGNGLPVAAYSTGSSSSRVVFSSPM